MKVFFDKVRDKNKKYYAILFSYLLILVIPLVCGSFIQEYNKTLANRQAESMTERMLESIKEQMDIRMNHIWQMGLLAAQLDSVNKVMNTKLQSYVDISYEYYVMMKELEKIAVFEDNIKDIFVYFKETDKIVGTQGVMSTDMYGKLFWEDRETGEELKAYFNSFHYKECRKLKNAKGEEEILCVISDPASFMDEPGYTVGIVIESRALEKLMESIRWMEESTVLIQDENGQILCGIGDMKDENLIEQIAAIGDTGGSYHETELLKEPCFVMAETSEEMDWKYYMVTPEDVVEKNAAMMQRFYLVMLFLCVFIGFGTAFVLTSKNYHPVKILAGLIAQYKSQNGAEETVSEEDSYQWLQQQTEQFFKERVNTMRMLKDNRKELKNYYLLRLLENTYTADLDENLRKNQIAFPHPFYTVIQFIIGEKENSADEQVLIKFVLRNIFTEMMEKDYVIYMVPVGERVAAIVNFSQEDRMAGIRKIVQQAQEMIEEKFFYEITALIGDCYGSRPEIFKAYTDTCEMEGYVNLLDDNLICYADVHDREKKYWYNAELDQKLFNAVKAGNQEIAEELLKEVLSQQYKEKISLSVYRCLMFDILGTILKAADAGGYHEAIEETQVVEKLSVRLPADQLEELFLRLIGDVCGRIHALQKEAGQNDDLSRKVQAYILENYRDPDLNVSLTGQHFHMTPSYLSTIYKKQTGSSMLEFINQVRLEEAERLLEQGLSVTEVAQQAGFRDSTYLIRVYKKKRGITPGQKKQKL